MSKNFLGTPSLIKRILAFIFDLLIINFIIVRPFNSILLKLVGEDNSFRALMSLAETNSSLVQNMSIVLFFISILALLYFTIFEWKFNQTIGQLLFKLSVKSEKGKLKFWQSLLNNIFILPFFPFFILWIVDPLYMFYKGQRLSEQMSKTKMVQEYVVENGKN